MFFNDSIVGTIIVRAVEFIGCTWSCDRSSDLHGVAECSNVSLAFSLSSSSFFFSSTFLLRLGTDAASLSPDCRTPGLSTICRSNLIIDLKCVSNVLLDSTGLQSAIFLADRFARLLNFFTLAHISHVRLWRSIDNVIGHVTVSQNC